MDIWSVENKNWTQLILWRTDKDTFMVVQAGDFTPLLTNVKYILIDKKYGEIFRKLAGQLTFQEVKVFDNNLKSEADNYIELNIVNTIDPSSIKSKDSNGFKIWRYADAIFVSGDLKTELSKISNDDFVFDKDFRFVGQ